MLSSVKGMWWLFEWLFCQLKPSLNNAVIFVWRRSSQVQHLNIFNKLYWLFCHNIVSYFPYQHTVLLDFWHDGLRDEKAVRWLMIKSFSTYMKYELVKITRVRCLCFSFICLGVSSVFKGFRLSKYAYFADLMCDPVMTKTILDSHWVLMHHEMSAVWYLLVTT